MRGLLAELHLHHGGDTQALVSGWSFPETDLVWGIGPESRLTMAVPQGRAEETDRLFLLIDAGPVHFGPMKQQVLVVYVNDVLVGSTVLNQPHSTTTGYALPPGCAAGAGTLDIVLAHPDAVRPNSLSDELHDTRELAVFVRRVRLFALPQAAEMAPHTLPALRVPYGAATAELGALIQGRAGRDLETVLLDIESLGNTCAYGFTQRVCGLEPLGLLRFSGFRSAGAKLCDALLTRLEGFGAADHVSVYLQNTRPHREYIVRDNVFDVEAHTDGFEDRADPAALLATYLRRTPYLVRRLLEDIDDGIKTFVLMAQDCLSAPAEAMAVFLALNLTADNTLVYVTVDGAPPGQVSLVGPGLMRASLSLGTGLQGTLESWIGVAANVYALKHGVPAAEPAGASRELLEQDR